jgi:hypothetical protein
LPAHRIVPLALQDGYVDGWPLTSPVGMFLEQIREGKPTVVAALVAALDPVDLARWSLQGHTLLARFRGRKVPAPRRPLSDFAVALDRAEAEAEAAMIDVVRETALGETKDSWRAAAWILEHSAKAAPLALEEPDDEDELERYSTPVASEE